MAVKHLSVESEPSGDAQGVDYRRERDLDLALFLS